MSERAVSDLVGFVLVFGLVVSVVAVVSVAGLDALETTRDAEETNNAERAFEVLANNVEDVSLRGAPSRATEISLSRNAVYLEDRIQVEVRDPDRGSGDPGMLVNRTFKPQPIVYDAGDTRLVYVMGAVFRMERDGGTVLQPWSPVLDERRTFVPVVNTRTATDGPQSVQSSTVLVRSISTHRVVEVANRSASFDDLWINVTSPRRDVWLGMLGRHPELDCSPVGSQTVECQVKYVPERVFVVDYRIAVDLET